MNMINKVEDITATAINAILSDNIFDQLKAEHNQLKDLLKKAKECSPSERERMLERIEELLVPHSRGEEKTIYSVLHERTKEHPRKEKELLDLTNEAYEEHRAVDDLMANLKETDVHDERWLAKLTVIKENLEHHIKEEENDLFKKAKHILQPGESEELLEAYLEAKEMYSENMPTQAQIRERQASQHASRLL